MGFWDFLTGGDSQVSQVNYPEWYSDPNFAGSQNFLDQYSKDLLNNGPNDYYAPIGEYGTQQFNDYITQTNGATLKGVDEALARTGRGRGGRSGEVAAQALGDRNASLAFQDYERALKGREMFLNTGLGVQQDVRNAGFANQSAHNAFNVGGANFDYNKAIYGDQYDRQQSEDIGKTIGTVVGGVGGFMVGGPAGAMAGAGIGSSVFGGGGGDGASTQQWLDIVNSAKAPGTKAGAGDAANGVSTLGKINPSDFLKAYSSYGFGG